MERKSYGERCGQGDGERNEKGADRGKEACLKWRGPLEGFETLRALEEVLMWKFSLRRASRFGLVLTFSFGSLVPGEAATKMKLHGYLTALADENTLLIWDDRIELTPASRVLGKDAAGEHSLNRQELSPGMLVEAEGQWLEKHRFFAEKLTVELGEDEKKIHGSAYLQEEPADAAKIAGGETSELKLDGYWLTPGPKTHPGRNPHDAHEV